MCRLSCPPMKQGTFGLTQACTGVKIIRSIVIGPQKLKSKEIPFRIADLCIEIANVEKYKSFCKCWYEMRSNFFNKTNFQSACVLFVCIKATSSAAARWRAVVLCLGSQQCQSGRAACRTHSATPAAAALLHMGRHEFRLWTTLDIRDIVQHTTSLLSSAQKWRGTLHIIHDCKVCICKNCECDPLCRGSVSRAVTSLWQFCTGPLVTVSQLSHRSHHNPPAKKPNSCPGDGDYFGY